MRVFDNELEEAGAGLLEDCLPSLARDAGVRVFDQGWDKDKDGGYVFAIELQQDPSRTSRPVFDGDALSEAVDDKSVRVALQSQLRNWLETDGLLLRSGQPLQRWTDSAGGTL